MSSIYDDTSCRCVQGIEVFLDPRNYTPSYGVFELIDDHPIDFQKFYTMVDANNASTTSSDDDTDVSITTKQVLKLVVQGNILTNKGYTRLKPFQLNSCFVEIDTLDTTWLESDSVNVVFTHNKLSKSFLVPVHREEESTVFKARIPNDVLLPGKLSVSMCTIDSYGEISSTVTNDIDYTIYPVDIKPIDWGSTSKFDVYYKFSATVNNLIEDVNKVEEKVEDLSGLEEINKRVTALEKALDDYKKAGIVPFGPIKIEKIQTYLYEAYYDALDYDNAIKFLNERYSTVAQNTLGACSACTSHGYYGRNYDWNYDNTVSFIVHTPNREGRYKVLGICGSFPALNKEVVEAREWTDFYKYMPMALLDGINEKGLCMNVNVTPDMAFGSTTGTNPQAETRLCAAMLCRYVLDHCATIDEAITTIKDKLNIFCPHNEKLNFEQHFMLTDGTSTKIIEFINNKVVVLNADNTTYAPIMTNFHVYGTLFDHDSRSIDYNSVSKYGDGVERYNLLAQGLDLVNSPNQMLTHMKLAKYTNTYSLSMDPLWRTEYLGGERTVKAAVETPEIFTEEIAKGVEEFNNRSRTEGPITWQTVHTSVYDIANKKLYVVPQEGEESEDPIIREV